jgi:3'-5' exoribonuclease
MITKKDFEKIYRSDNRAVVALSNVIFAIPNFYEWSGSGYKGQHHYGESGLITHTLEVLKIMFCVDKVMDYRLNKDILFLSGLYHDYGKLYDYKKNEHEDWVPTSHKRNIHHISRSAMFFYHTSMEYDIGDDLRDSVLHCILSHHTRREYGSPVAPNSREAWLLTLADNMSARLNDCDSWDYIVK